MSRTLTPTSDTACWNCLSSLWPCWPVYFLGFLGWELPTYGGSLLVPTVIVFAVGLTPALASLGLGSFRRGLQPLRIFSVIVAVFTVAASIWTFGFSLPTSIAWDPGATQQAQLTRPPRADGKGRRSAASTLHRRNSRQHRVSSGAIQPVPGVHPGRARSFLMSATDTSWVNGGCSSGTTPQAVALSGISSTAVPNLT
jgi:hypothetical protein